ncbi:MAG: cupredoxin domain-containing protein [Actinomycetota bacterium]
MRRSLTALAMIFSLALVGAACAKQKDTGFPPIPTASPSSSVAPSPTAPVTAVTLVAKNIQWDLSTLLFKAGEKITVTVDNQDSGVPHNFGVYSNAQRTPDKEIFKPGGDVTGPGKKDYTVPALKAGTYYFQCDIHPSMNGTLTVQ